VDSDIRQIRIFLGIVDNGDARARADLGSALLHICSITTTGTYTPRQSTTPGNQSLVSGSGRGVE